jgi:hypothetical protein
VAIFDLTPLEDERLEAEEDRLAGVRAQREANQIVNLTTEQLEDLIQQVNQSKSLHTLHHRVLKLQSQTADIFHQ